MKERTGAHQTPTEIRSFAVEPRWFSAKVCQSHVRLGVAMIPTLFELAEAKELHAYASTI